LKKLEKILIITFLLLSIALGTGLGIIIAAFTDTSDIASLENFQPEIPSKIYDRHGNLISEIFTVKREPIPFEDIPKDLINAILAIEDDQFYQHHGVNIKRVFGAILANIKTMSKSQGASTITMQLARTLFTGREKTWARKIKETWLALKIEKKYSKNEILTLYFNQIYFGHGAYGVQAAADFFFNKRVEDLTLAECALLAGLPQAPNRLSPLKNPELARKRQELVLERMVELGMVSAKQAYDSFQDFWVDFRLQMRSPSQTVYKLAENKAPHFVEYVRQKLEKLYGSKTVYTGGLKVYTSLDLEQQALAEKYLKEGLERQNRVYQYTMEKVKDTLDRKILDSLDMLSMLFELKTLNISSTKTQTRVLEYINNNMIAPLDMLSFIFSNDKINRIVESSFTIDQNAGDYQEVEGAIIAIEPKTGYITAMVGGSRFSEDNQLNRAVQIARQTGSGFKPYIYTAAIDTKIFTPASIIVDSPVVFYESEEPWIPSNYSGTYHGKVRLREALRRSINVVTAKVLDRLGVETVIKYASSILGITEPEEIRKKFPKVYSLALGVVELSPYEQAKGFATFANQGKEVTPIAILYVLDRNGNLIDNFEAELRKKQLRGQRRIISEQTNYIMLDMLRDVMRPGGTGYRAAVENGFNRPAGGKTGTTQNWKDAWFTGFTPDLVASVWVGFDRNNISLGRGQAGGVVAAPIWAKFMRDALKDTPPSWYSRPKGVYAINICKKSGLLPTRSCTDTMTEYFLDGTIPTQYCQECGTSQTGDSFNINIFKRKKPTPLEGEESPDQQYLYEQPYPDESFSPAPEETFPQDTEPDIQTPPSVTQKNLQDDLILPDMGGMLGDEGELLDNGLPYNENNLEEEPPDLTPELDKKDEPEKSKKLPLENEIETQEKESIENRESAQKRIPEGENDTTFPETPIEKITDTEGHSEEAGSTSSQENTNAE